jgi:hypothetical protein
MEIAPPIAICATCACQCGGELVTVGMEYDRVARGELPVFKHATASLCSQARERSARFWTGAREQVRHAA